MKWSYFNSQKIFTGRCYPRCLQLLACSRKLSQLKVQFWGPPLLNGFVSAFHSAVPGSNPKQTIYASSICSQIDCTCQCVDKGTKINKNAGFGQFLKSAMIVNLQSFSLFCFKSSSKLSSTIILNSKCLCDGSSMQISRHLARYWHRRPKFEAAAKFF